MSIHVPLTRLLAGLTLHMEKFNISWDSPEITDSAHPLLDQVLGSRKKILFLVDSPLRREGVIH